MTTFDLDFFLLLASFVEVELDDQDKQLQRTFIERLVSFIPDPTILSL
jgi:hypothetical protein